MKSALSLALTALLLTASLHGQDRALLRAEQARGVLTGDTGVQWIVDVQNTGGETKRAKFLAVSQGGKIYAEVVQPENAKGHKYLAESGGNMWFWKPGLSRPVSVSRRRRLTGDAAIGDVASTSYVDGYEVAGRQEGEVGGEPAWIYTMEANSLSDTYAKIKYWVTKEESLGKKAEFYARSGNLLRTSTMEYGNRAKGRPFLSKMVIRDSNRTITLQFGNVKIDRFPARLFTREHLGGPPRSSGRRK